MENTGVQLVIAARLNDMGYISQNEELGNMNEQTTDNY